MRVVEPERGRSCTPDVVPFAEAGRTLCALGHGAVYSHWHCCPDFVWGLPGPATRSQGLRHPVISWEQEKLEMLVSEVAPPLVISRSACLWGDSLRSPR